MQGLKKYKEFLDSFYHIFLYLVTYGYGIHHETQTCLD